MRILSTSSKLTSLYILSTIFFYPYTANAFAVLCKYIMWLLFCSSTLIRFSQKSLFFSLEHSIYEQISIPGSDFRLKELKDLNLLLVKKKKTDDYNKGKKEVEQLHFWWRASSSVIFLRHVHKRKQFSQFKLGVYSILRDVGEKKLT